MPPSYLALVVSHEPWVGALTQRLVSQLVQCGAPERTLQRAFDDRARGFVNTRDSTLRLVLAGVCSPGAARPRAAQSLFYTTDAFLGPGTIGSGATSRTSVLQQVRQPEAQSLTG